MKVCLITGATSGIGLATAHLFADSGYSLLLTGRNQSKLESLRQELKCDVEIIAADLSKLESVATVIHQLKATYNQLDVLVNAAGIIENGSIENTSFERWDYMFKVNLDSPMLLIQQAIPFLEQSKGAIVNVSSVVGLRQFPNVFSYSVSKAAFDQLTKVAALELAPKGIRVNAVNPGVTVTELHKRGGMDDEVYNNFLEHSKTTHPIGRVGQPEEIADLIAFLASEKSGWITGETIAIDGGRHLTCFR